MLLISYYNLLSEYTLLHEGSRDVYTNGMSRPPLTSLFRPQESSGINATMHTRLVFAVAAAASVKFFVGLMVAKESTGHILIYFLDPITLF